MPSGQDYVSRLREETRRTLATHVRGFEEELRNLQTNLAASFGPIARNLGSILDLEVPAMEAIVAEAVADENREGNLRRAEEMLSLARFTYNMRRKETQDEILSSLLDGAHRYAPRLALFVARAHNFIGWSSRGFTQDIARELGRCHLAFAESPLLQRALEADGLTTANDLSQEAALSKLLTRKAEGPLHAFPMRALGRPVAVLLASPAEGRGCDLESLCILMDMTGLCIENVALKVLQEMRAAKPAAPTPAPLRAAAEPVVAATQSATAEMPESVTAEPSPVLVEEEAMPTIAPVEGAPAIDDEVAPPEEVHLGLVAPSDPEARAEEPAAEAPVAGFHAPQEPPFPEPPAIAESAVAAAREEPGEPVAALEPSPSADEHVPVEVQEPAPETFEPVRTAILRGVQPLTEEEKLHADAKRFARLLASEIKLYNEQRVQEGRANRDLYVRLKRDIDRSRDMYEKRVSPVVCRRIDYFHDEIIRVLGDNDSATLGSDYPGPRVES